jgi:hypothetical protein
VIPGITASNSARHSSGGGGYQASAVTFGGGTTLVNSSLSSTDNNFVSFAGWFKPTTSDFAGVGTVPFVVDPSGRYLTFLEWGGVHAQITYTPSGASASAQFVYDSTNNPLLVAGAWCHIVGSFDGTGGSPHACKMDVNNATSTLTPNDNNVTISPLANGLPFWVGGDGQGDAYFGSMADFSFWPGVSFLSGGAIPLATRRLFIDATGAPVNPATAIATLGRPSVMLSGNASVFRLNILGGSGAFTLTTGSLTNDSSAVHL